MQSSTAIPGSNIQEEFDSSLIRINSLEKLQHYCDSVVKEEMNISPGNPQRYFSEALAKFIRYRFFHGYSYYQYKNNYLGKAFADISGKDIDAIVLPSDILKYPNAACSQQSIVAMRILKKNRIPVRSVIFEGDSSGHFCYEAYYEGSWHFFDTNMEPDVALLQSYNRPGIQFMVDRPDLLLKAYHKYSYSKVLGIFSRFELGEINQLPARRATIFQQTTKFLSAFAWLFFLFLFLILRMKYSGFSK